MGIPEGSMVIGCVARLDPVKDHGTLLRAYARLARAHPTVHLLLVGEGPQRPVLEREVAQLGLAGRVHFAGARSNRPNLHGLVDISVLTSQSEGFPNTIVEAMAAGRPVVATRVGGVPDAVEHGRTGLLVDPGDDEALAVALDALLTDEVKRATLGREARERARRLYHRDRVLPELEALYERCRARRIGVRGRAVCGADAAGARA